MSDRLCPLGEHTTILAKLEAIEKITERSLKSVESNIQNMFTTLEKSIELARVGMEKRLEGMNEFRDTLKDQAAKFVTRDELSIQIQHILKELQALRTFKDGLQGMATQKSVGFAQGIAVLSLCISLLGAILIILKMFGGVVVK